MRMVSVKTWSLGNPVLEYGVWGSNTSRVRNWTIGEEVVILVGHEGVITGRVSGEAHTDPRVIWDNDLFDWRVPIDSVRKHAGQEGAELNASIRSVLRRRLGGVYGYVLHNQAALPGVLADELRVVLEHRRG